MIKNMIQFNEYGDPLPAQLTQAPSVGSQANDMFRNHWLKMLLALGAYGYQTNKMANNSPVAEHMGRYNDSMAHANMLQSMIANGSDEEKQQILDNLEKSFGRRYQSVDDKGNPLDPNTGEALSQDQRLAIYQGMFKNHANVSLNSANVAYSKMGGLFGAGARAIASSKFGAPTINLNDPAAIKRAEMLAKQGMATYGQGFNDRLDNWDPSTMYDVHQKMGERIASENAPKPEEVNIHPDANRVVHATPPANGAAPNGAVPDGYRLATPSEQMAHGVKVMPTNDTPNQQRPAPDYSKLTGNTGQGANVTPPSTPIKQSEGVGGGKLTNVNASIDYIHNLKQSLLLNEYGTDINILYRLLEDGDIDIDDIDDPQEYDKDDGEKDFVPEVKKKAFYHR